MVSVVSAIPDEPYIIIQADSVNESAFNINDVEIDKFTDNQWILYTNESDINVGRAKLYSTLFYGTDGTNPAVVNISNPTNLYNSQSEDVDRNGYYAKLKSSASEDGRLYLNFTDTTSNTVDYWVTLTHSGATNSYLYNENSLLHQSIFSNINTDTSSLRKTNPINLNLRTFADAGESSSAKLFLLSKQDIDFDNVSTTGSPTFEHINFYEDYSIPAFEETNYINLSTGSLFLNNVTYTVSEDIVLVQSNVTNDYEELLFQLPDGNVSFNATTNSDIIPVTLNFYNNSLPVDNVTISMNYNGIKIDLTTLTYNTTIPMIDNIYVADVTYNGVDRVVYLTGQNQNINLDTDEFGFVLTEDYDTHTVYGATENYEFNVTFDETVFNSSSNSMIINLGGTNYTPTNFGYSDYSRGVYTYTIPTTANTLNHKWYFNIDLFNGTTLTTNTSNKTQYVYNTSIDNCSTFSYPIINFSIYDQVNYTYLSADISYNLQVDDGYNEFNVTGGVDNQQNFSLCSGVPPTNLTYNWDLTGNILLSKTDYTGNTYEISNPIVASNNPITQKDLFMINVNESTSVSMTWLGDDYQLINGVLEIYKCNTNGTETLVQSLNIIEGNVVANLVLFTTLYKYKVIIDGVTYSESSYNTCHVENTNEVTYYVTVSEVDLEPVLGILFASCSITNSSNDVTMQWQIDDDLTNDFEACILGLRTGLNGQSLIYENCTTSNTGTLVVQVPDNDNVYTVKGKISNNDNTAYCNQVITFGEQSSNALRFGNEGLFAVIFIILAFALYYAGDSNTSLIASAIAVLLTWIFGILSLGWLEASALVLVLVIVVIVGRTKK